MTTKIQIIEKYSEVITEMLLQKLKIKVENHPCEWFKVQVITEDSVANAITKKLKLPHLK